MRAYERGIRGTRRRRLSIALIAACAVACGLPADSDRTPNVARQAVSPAPYPPSPVFTGIAWHYSTHVQLAQGSDIWSATWSAGAIFAFWGDGGGFGGSNSDHRVSLGLAKISGAPPSVTGTNIWGNATAPQSGGWAEYQATFCGKADSIVAVDGTLYAFVSSWYNATSNEVPSCPSPNPSPPQHELVWSTDRGQSWQQATWKLTANPGALWPATFIQFGEDGAGEPDALAPYIYFYAYKSDDFSDVYLGRALPADMQDYTNYQVFAGLDASGNPTWAGNWDASRAKPVFSDANGASGFEAVLHAGTGRFLATAYHGVDVNGDLGAEQDFGMFDAPAPWGPWTTVEYTDTWGPPGSPFGTEEAETMSTPLGWMSADGTTLWAIFSSGNVPTSTNPGDALNLMQATLTVTVAGGVDAGSGQVDGGAGSVDAGVPQVDAGPPPLDAGPSPVADAGATPADTTGAAPRADGGNSDAKVSGGCGCAAAESGAIAGAWLWLIAAWLLRTRTRA